MIKIISELKYRGNQVLARMSFVTGWSISKPEYVCAKMIMRCNSKCVHCNIWKTNFNERQMSFDEWIRALNGLRKWLGPFRIAFTGGEALLRDDMVSILSHAVKIGIRVELLSNGLKIDDVLAGKIVDTGIDQITMSFDGLSPEVHDRFRGGTGFHALTTAAIKAFLNRKNSPRILLKTVISANNIHELAGIAQCFSDPRLQVMYQPIEQNYGEQVNCQWYHGSPWWIRDLETLKCQFDKLKEIKNSGNVIANPITDFSLFYDYFANPDVLMSTIQRHGKKLSNICTEAMGNFVISSNGDVQMCFEMKPIGNLMQNTPKEIWSKRPKCWMTPCGYRQSSFLVSGI